ncbi:MAG: S9 family peptidase [Nocardioidaceae bacterium]
MTSAVPPPQPPVAPRRPTERVHHGHTFVDDYEWLRDPEDPETIGYLEAENAYTARRTEHLTHLRDTIFGEIKGRTQETDLSVPSRAGNYWYYSRTAEGAQYPRFCRNPAQDADWTPPGLDAGSPVAGEVVLLDVNQIADGHAFFALGSLSVSLDGNLLAYSVDVTGDERYTVRVLDLRTGQLLGDELPGTLHAVTWSADGDQLFYSTVDESWRPDKVWRHRVGSSRADDQLVHHERDERFWCSVNRTTSDRFLMLTCGSKITSEVHLLEADRPTDSFRVVVPRETGIEYEVDHAAIAGEDMLVVLHNKKASNFTLGLGPLTLSSLDDLETVVAGDADVRLDDVCVSASTLTLNLREGGLPQVRLFELGRDGLGEGANISFEEPLFDAHAEAPTDWRQPFVRLTYSSWLTPRTVIDYDPAAGARHVRRQRPVLGGYDPADYVQAREWVTAEDGARIPVSIVRHKDVQPRGRSPLLLYGYGSYEISCDPAMSIARLSLLDRGVVFVVAHVRGGGEMGRNWYEQGRLLQKKNTFTDFVACADHLVATGWTTAASMVALGGSAGGLLMGAVANLRPDLFAGIVAQVPFVDPLTSILDPSLPLTVIEWDEWGDPLHDVDVYAYMASYSPYENVEPKDYPAIYALTSLHDTRVLYVEPAKWVARVRAAATGGGQLLLKCEMSAGHGGASGRYDAWRETADYFAWILDVCGANQEPAAATAIGPT